MTAAGLILRAQDTGRILLLLRPEALWNFPGGRLERGESPLQAAIRETREETGYRGNVTVDSASVAAVLSNSRGGPPSLTPPPSMRGACLAYVAFRASEPSEIHPVLDGENIAARWVRREEIPRLPLHPGVLLALEISDARRSAASH